MKSALVLSLALTFGVPQIVLAADGSAVAAQATVQERLQVQVTSIQALPLKKGPKQSMTKRLQMAIKRIDGGRPKQACGLVASVASTLEDLVADGKLTEAQAGPIVAELDAVAVELGCSTAEPTPTPTPVPTPVPTATPTP